MSKPFDFADLNGKPEPDHWGPMFHKSRPAPKPRRVNDETSIPTNAPSGQKTPHVCSALLRAKIRAEQNAVDARERRDWALGKSKDRNGHTIVDRYKQAMREKNHALR